MPSGVYPRKKKAVVSSTRPLRRSFVEASPFRAPSWEHFNSRINRIFVGAKEDCVGKYTKYSDSEKANLLSRLYDQLHSFEHDVQEAAKDDEE